MWYHEQANASPMGRGCRIRRPATQARAGFGPGRIARKEETMACEFVVKGGSLPREELDAYLARAVEKFGRAPRRIDILVEGEEVALDYTFDAPRFERIRRITGYLVGTLDRFNNGKRAEEHDRVIHQL